MIREFNEQCQKDYVRTTVETIEGQTDKRKSASEENVQREDIDEAMGEGGGDEEEDGESEDDNEDGHGSGAAKRPGTQRRKLRSFYFRTGAVVRTTTDNGGSSISKSFRSSVVWDLYRLTCAGAFWTPP